MPTSVKKQFNLKNLQEAFQSKPNVASMNYLQYLLCGSKSRKAYKDRLRKAHQTLDREMDFKKFVLRQRM